MFGADRMYSAMVNFLSERFCMIPISSTISKAMIAIYFLHTCLKKKFQFQVAHKRVMISAKLETLC